MGRNLRTGRCLRWSRITRGSWSPVGPESPVVCVPVWSLCLPWVLSRGPESPWVLFSRGSCVSRGSLSPIGPVTPEGLYRRGSGVSCRAVSPVDGISGRSRISVCPVSPWSRVARRSGGSGVAFRPYPRGSCVTVCPVSPVVPCLRWSCVSVVLCLP
jgi:hypothetical protein